MLTLESPTIYCGNTMCNDCLLGAFLWWCSTWDQNQQMINKITDCSVSVVNKCQLQTHVGHCNQILGHILGYSLKISEKSVSKIYIKKCLKQILCWTLSHLVRLWTAKQPTFSPTRKTKKCFHPDSLCFGQTFRPSTGSGPKAENQVIRLVIRIKTTHDVHFGNNVGEDLLGVCKFY